MSSPADDPELDRVLEILRRRQREGNLDFHALQDGLRQPENRLAANDALPAGVILAPSSEQPVQKAVDREADEYFSYLANLTDPTMTAEDRLDAYERSLSDFNDEPSLDDQIQAKEAMDLAVAREMERVEKAWQEAMEPIVANAKRSEQASEAALNPKDTLDNRMEAAGRAESYNGVVQDRMATNMSELRPALAQQSMQRLEGMKGFDPDAHAIRLQMAMKPPHEVAQADRKLDAAKEVVARHQKGRDHGQDRQYDQDLIYRSEMAPH